MTEKELIKKIQELRQIEPRKDWVIFAKERILGEEFSKAGTSAFGWQEFIRGMRVIFQHKFAFASLLVVMVFVGLLGTFGFAQNSLPGDSLYLLKRITEKSRAVFVSEKDQPKHNLEIVNKRLDDLAKVAQTNEINNLAPAIEEVQKSEKQAVESLNNLDIKKDPDKVKEIVIAVKDVLKNKKAIEKVLATKIGDESLEEAVIPYYKISAERLIKEMENRRENNSLTEEQEESLAGAKKSYEEEDYIQAFEKILLLSQ